jgi:hypothetical protein
VRDQRVRHAQPARRLFAQQPIPFPRRVDDRRRARLRAKRISPIQTTIAPRAPMKMLGAQSPPAGLAELRRARPSRPFGGRLSRRANDQGPIYFQNFFGFLRQRTIGLVVGKSHLLQLISR